MISRITAFTFGFLLLISAGIIGVANVYIPANQEFVLGEYEQSGFTTKLTNAGKQDILVRIANKKTEEESKQLNLTPGSESKLSVSKYEKVYLVNRSNSKAHVRVKLNKGVEGMRYQDLD